MTIAYVHPQPSYRCPACEITSFHPDDVRNRYCSNCHSFEADDEMLVQVLIDKALASHRATATLPKTQVLRALRLLQAQHHRRQVAATFYANEDPI